MKRLNHPATIVAAAALFMSLGGGAYATVQTLISGTNLKNRSVPEIKLNLAAVADLQGPVFSTYDTGLVALTNTGLTQVASLTLAAGSYIVIGKTVVVDDTESADEHCVLNDGSNDIDAAFTYTQAGLSIPSQQTMSLEGPEVTTGGTVTLKCQASGPNASARNSHLTAIKVGPITGS